MPKITRSKVSRGAFERENLLEVQNEKVEMTLNTDSAVASGLLIQRLTELYENPIKATVRETVSNAMDAIAVGSKDEKGVVRITSPTKLQPIFKVEDTGCGMTYEDLKNVYAKYGASTKMDNFDQIGAYGLGAKAPLAYGTEFTVSSTKDGVCTTIIVAREELTNYIKIIDSVKTDKPNGTTVSIPVAKKDIEEFKYCISNYKNYPFSKDNLEIFVDWRKVDCDNFTHLSNEIPIFEEKDGLLTSNIWIRNDVSSIFKMISAVKYGRIMSNILYTIGGWPYNPEKRSFRQNEKTIVVELKPGVVDFNSSRDTILPNENYDKFKDLVEKYISSESFIDKVISKVNTGSLNEFKEMLNLILNDVKHNIKINGDSICLKDENNPTSQKPLISLDKLVHEETGYSASHMFKGVPKKHMSSVLILEDKRGYSSRSNFYCLSNGYGDKTEYLPIEKNRNISDVEKFINESFLEEKKSEHLKNLILYLTISLKKDSHLTFITDMKYSDKKDSEYYKVKSGRNLIPIINGFNSSNFESYVLYTAYSKKEIEEALKFTLFNSKKVFISTAEDFVKSVEEHKKKNKKEKKVVSKTKLYSFNHSNMRFEEISKIEKKNGVKNIIFLSKTTHVRIDLHEMLENCVYNLYGLKKDEFNIYYSIGTHRVHEILHLSSLGELHQYPISEPAGTSKVYFENVNINKLGLHILRNDEADLNKKAFIATLEIIQNHYYHKNTIEIIAKEIKKVRNIAKILGMKMEQEQANLDDLVNFSKEMNYNLMQNEGSLFDSSHLVSLLTESQKSLIEKLSELNCLKNCSLKDGIESYNFSFLFNSIPNEDEAVLINSNKEVPFIKEAKERFENFANKVEEMNKCLLELDFI